MGVAAHYPVAGLSDGEQTAYAGSQTERFCLEDNRWSPHHFPDRTDIRAGEILLFGLTFAVIPLVIIVYFILSLIKTSLKMAYRAEIDIMP